MTTMTKADMEKALQTGFNKQGRTVSESMRAKYLAALAHLKPALNTSEYRGFRIEGNSGKYFVEGLPHMILSSIPKAHAAIDRCLNLRAELSHDN